MPVTFKVADVSRVEPHQRFPGPIELADSVRSLAEVQVEACGSNQSNLIGFYEDPWNGTQKLHGLVRAIHHSFEMHLPLVLSPDDIWIAIAQGFANHVNANSDRFRHLFVNPVGKEALDDKIYIEIERDLFVKGSSKNDWQGAFSEFSDRIAEYIGPKRDLIVSDFSTTTVIERAASEVVLLDAMQSYFSFGCKTCCGIPQITLLGTEDDWSSILDRASRLEEFDCKWWVDGLKKVIAHFVAAFKGDADLKFWNSLYKEGNGSGGPYVTGAVNAFFPYLIGRGGKFNAQNKFVEKWDQGLGCMFGGPTTDEFPTGISGVPFTWLYYEKKIPMQFIGGFVGTSHDPETDQVRPALGWAIGPAKG